MKIVFSTRNQHKIKEVNAILPKNIELLSLDDIGFNDEIEETGKTLEENSKLKAKLVYDFCGIPVVAEDTGLEIKALNDEPGVYSARYAGTGLSADNMKLVLEKLKNEKNRKAQFRTVATYVDNNTYYIFEGIVLGEITTNQKGEDGFGYDPIFLPDGFGKVFAEMTMEEKSIISHRAIAFNKLAQFLIKHNQ